jgi:hypothetical protein
MHYMILMSKKMTSQKKLGEIKSVPYNKPLGTTTQPLIPSLNSHFSQVRISMLLFLFLSCCIPSLGKRAYGSFFIPKSHVPALKHPTYGRIGCNY